MPRLVQYTEVSLTMGGVTPGCDPDIFIALKIPDTVILYQSTRRLKERQTIN